MTSYRAVVIRRGTGGLKKIRFGADWRGKSGSWRAIYADYPQYNIVVLMAAFPKGIQATLTAEQSRELRQIKQITDREMEKRYGRK